MREGAVPKATHNEDRTEFNFRSVTCRLVG